jgi:hypothetical protein
VDALDEVESDVLSGMIKCRWRHGGGCRINRSARAGVLSFWPKCHYGADCREEWWFGGSAGQIRPAWGRGTGSVLGYLPSLNVHDGFSLESKVRDLDLQWSREGSGLFFFFF